MNLKYTTMTEIRVGTCEHLRRLLSDAAWKAKNAAEKITHADENPRKMIVEAIAQMNECERLLNAIDEVGNL